MKKIIILVMFGLFLSTNAMAGQQYIENLTIDKIRTVGNYTGTVFDDTVELWFTSPLVFSPHMTQCTETLRVYIHSSHSHMVSAAYAAYLADKKVSINLDDALNVRYGSCEVSYMDILK